MQNNIINITNAQIPLLSTINLPNLDHDPIMASPASTTVLVTGGTGFIGSHRKSIFELKLLTAKC
jgi:FlaA1/EpsC-like NDP-sugar epimerase